LPDEKKEQWGWIDEHIERPTPEVAGEEVRIIGKGSIRPDQDVTDQESVEQQADRVESKEGSSEGSERSPSGGA
jgi:hypothetical protein